MPIKQGSTGLVCKQGSTEIVKICKGTDVIYQKEEPVTGETWLLNETINTVGNSFTVDFISNNTQYSSINRSMTPGPFNELYYDGDPVYYNGWENQAYRIVYFPIPPTGDLLTWLEANGHKQ